MECFLVRVIGVCCIIGVSLSNLPNMLFSHTSQSFNVKIFLLYDKIETKDKGGN